MNIDMFLTLMIIAIFIFSALLYFGFKKVVYLYLKFNKSYSCEAKLLDKKGQIISGGANPRVIAGYKYIYNLEFMINEQILVFQVDETLYEEAEIGKNYKLNVEANEITSLILNE